MKLFDFLMNFGNSELYEFNFKLSDDYYDFSSLKPEILDDEHTIIFGLHKSCKYNNVNAFKKLMLLNHRDNLDYTVILRINEKFYDLNGLVEQKNNSRYLHFELKEYTPKTTDYVTLNMIHKNAKDFGIPYCDYDFNNAPITIKVNGVAVKLKHKDVHFIIDEVKGEGANYNVVLDVRTK